MDLMGERIKRRREKLHIQASELAKSIGVTASLISQIERAKAFPSILTLKKIADALHITVGALIGEESSLNLHPLVHAGEKKFVKKNKTGTKSHLLSHHDPDKIMDPFFLDFPVKGNSQDIMTTNNPRQEYCYVVKGAFDVVVGANSYTIKEGDSFYFTSKEQHLFTNTYSANSQLLWVVNQSS